MRQPDANGNLIPDYMQEGSAVISNPKGRAEWMTVAVCGAFYNPRKATCAPVCIYCYGYNTYVVVATSFSVGVNGTVQLNTQATYADGSVDTFTSSSSWSSNNNSVATVGANTGLVRGVSPGSIQIMAEFPSLVEYAGNLCSYGGLTPCPVGSPGGASNGSVPPTITGFTPGRGLIGNSISVTIDGIGFGTNPTVQVSGNGVTATVGSGSGDTQIEATFAITTGATAGNHAVTVTNNSVSPAQTSSSQNWFVQVPGDIQRYDLGTGSPAPNGYGPLVILDPAAGTNYGNVVNINGQVLKPNQCGVYRNLAYALYDQDSPAQLIYGGYTANESFSNFSGIAPAPSAVSTTLPLNSLVFGDNSYIGSTAPTCLGANDNQSFNQSFTVTVGSGASQKTYSVTLTNAVSRGKFSGTYADNITITTQ